MGPVWYVQEQINQILLNARMNYDYDIPSLIQQARSEEMRETSTVGKSYRKD